MLRMKFMHKFIHIFFVCLAIIKIDADHKQFYNIGQIHRLTAARHGWFLHNLKDMYIGRSLDEYGEWSENELFLFLKLIQPGDIVLDIGANIGTFTIPLAKHVGFNGKVYAFEAQRFISYELTANVALNKLENVYVYNWGIGQIDETIKIPKAIYDKMSNFGGFSLKMDVAEQDRLETLQLRSLDSLRSSFAGCPSFIKLDIEGMELEAFIGAKNLIDECHPTIYFENNLKKNSEILLRHMETHGYEMYWDIQPCFNPHNFFNNSSNFFPSYGFSYNTLAIHPQIKNGRSIELKGYTRIRTDLGKYYTHQYLISNPILNERYYRSQLD